MWRQLRETHCVDSVLAQEVERDVKALSGVCAPAQLPLRPNNSLQHRLLRLYSVFQCCRCSYIARYRKSMKMHGNQQYTLHNVTNAELLTTVKGQSWTAGQCQQYWTVNDTLEDEQNYITPTQTIVAAAAPLDLSELIAQISVQTEEQTLQRQQLTQRPTANELSPWLKHTGWNAALTVSALTFQQLTAFKRLSDTMETNLRRLIVSFDRVLQRAIATMANTDADLLLWLHSSHNESVAKRLFAALQDAASLPHYVAY